ncbi:PfaD family polyunsaturated fatty acid/polyketide biosynthesis protein [Sphingobium yanoikuyae]|uniref:[acyl-carrier-protein] S-malonyltransferase n=1 Tax=Sphingobium yanoikuyae TaxID=13690 RepID=A0AA42X0X4_SPHYA|nr:PfaD family polyunsaturated fatty acid/polyketide biosynthesis protein [Sphingobium yanoikuyae]MDH2135025.1 PfaD family polyunsaturated fatty acid/polyketide biosynthesis protein [Sphingobium yanoikuyae]MDH2170396.1 PfaD family polyunsaturated fatty acid/polyketide biosynthesis protein [Sphingobium yanoikuyae]
MRALIFPGQGAQYPGMEKELFERFPNELRILDDALGCSAREICQDDKDGRLNFTKYTQPIIYTVNALSYQSICEDDPNLVSCGYTTGHSLGEYNALLAAGAFDFSTGLRLVIRRGALMAEAASGAMIAVIGVSASSIEARVADLRLRSTVISNFNSAQQLVVSGEQSEIALLYNSLDAAGARTARLNVSGAFHSPLMRDARNKFAQLCKEVEFRDPKVAVIANATARPYLEGAVANTLVDQITSPVKWAQTIEFLASQGVSEIVEVGAGAAPHGRRAMLSKFVAQTLRPEDGWSMIGHKTMRQPKPAPDQQNVDRSTELKPMPIRDEEPESSMSMPGERLGSEVFRARYGLKYAYVAGSMYRGIASVALVCSMAKAGMLSFLGTGGMDVAEIKRSLDCIRVNVDEFPFGANLLANYDDPQIERQTIDLYLREGIKVVEASAFMEITLPLAYYRCSGLYQDAQGQVCSRNHVVAKVSRLEVAEAFMRPIPDGLLSELLARGEITPHQERLARLVPVANDICVEADSGGHTDRGIAMVLFPEMRRLRDRIVGEQGYAEVLHIGLAGGIGTPDAVAAAFLAGADFVLTGSINQCTIEAGASDLVKDLLQEMGVHDTEYAPAGDLFEAGSKVQVLKRGVLFPVRANKLFALYSNFDSVDEIPEKTRRLIEQTYFKKTIEDVWSDVSSRLQRMGRVEELEVISSNSKRKMSAIFKWYFGHSTRVALDGVQGEIINFQVHTGPALGAFNAWVRGSPLESWRSRNVDVIALRMMEEAEAVIKDRSRALTGQFDSVRADNR